MWQDNFRRDSCVKSDEQVYLEDDDEIPFYKICTSFLQ